MSFIFNLRLFKALSRRPILTLWTGEAFSAIGDEIYKVALIWLLVGMIGADTGYLAAAQAGAVLIFGLLGSIWADQWDPRRTMFRVDVIRGVLVLIPVVWAWFRPLNLEVLVTVAVSVSALSSFFEPALQAVIPRLAPDRELMQATNGLMGTTMRLARAVGPGLVGSLTGIIPIIHFFTLDSISFGVSAIAITKLRRELPPLPRAERPPMTMWRALNSGFEAIREDSLMKYVIYSKAVTNGTWSLVFPLGIALLIQKLFPGDIRAYGMILAAYGVGNLASALFLANISITRPARTMGAGFIVLGLGFVAMTLTPSLPVMMVASAWAAIGGPMNDLAHIDLLQRRYPPDELVRIVRFRMVMECAGIVVCLLAAPMLFKTLSPKWVIFIAGLVTAIVGAIGVFYFSETGKTKLKPMGFT